MLGPQLVMLFLEVLKSLEGGASLRKTHWGWVLGGVLFLVPSYLALCFLSPMKRKIPFMHIPTEMTFYPGVWAQVTVTQAL